MLSKAYNHEERQSCNCDYGPLHMHVMLVLSAQAQGGQEGGDFAIVRTSKRHLHSLNTCCLVMS